MRYYKFLKYKSFLTFCLSVSFIAFLFAAWPRDVLAACDPNDDPNSADCVCPVGEVTYLSDHSQCQAHGVYAPADTCTGQESNWLFTYWLCTRTRSQLIEECEYTYTEAKNTCSAVDRCEGASLPASGFAANGHILSGQCDAGAFKNNDPNTACVSGGFYKQCCQSDGYAPRSACNSGVCESGHSPAPNDTTPCDISVNLVANPTSIAHNSSSTLTWSSQGTTGGTCTASVDWSGGKSVPSGSESTSRLSGTPSGRTYNYTLSCSNDGVSANDPASVSVSPPSAQACTVDIKANGSDGPITITIPSGASGASASLTWTSSNDTDNSLGASGSWTGTKSTSNTTGESTGLRAAGTYSYALTCNGTDGVERSNTVTVNVTTTPKKCSELQPGATCKTPGANETCTPISDSRDCPTSCYTCVPAKYKCSGTSCVRDDIGGNYTTSNCDNKCAPAVVTGSCSLSASATGSTTGTAQVTDIVTGFDKVSWYFGTTTPPPFITTLTSTSNPSWSFDGLTPSTPYYVKAERSAVDGSPTQATCKDSSGSQVTSFTTTGPTPPPGGGGGGGGVTSCWSWYSCINSPSCERDKEPKWSSSACEGSTRFESGTTTDCNPAANGTLDGRCPNGVHHFGSCGTCGGGGGGGGASCTTGWSGVGGGFMSCGTPVPGGYMARQLRTTMTGGGGNDGRLSWYGFGSSGATWNATDGSTITIKPNDQNSVILVGDTKETDNWGLDKLISGGTFRVGCNDGESGSFLIERCNPVCDNTAPSAPTLSSPGNGSTVVSSPVTLTFSHNGNFGTACAGGNNRLKVFAGVGSPSSVVCDLPPGSTSCQTTVSDGQNYQWKVQATNGALSSDSATWAFSVLFNSGGWFQVQDSDVTSPGDLISRIPLRCTGNCVPQFGLSGGGGYPGVPAYGGSNADFGGGSVSLKEWLANTRYSGRRYDYAWFAKLAPTGVFTDPASVITDSQISGGDLVSGFASGGYFWRYKNGDLTVNGTANMGDRKVILFVNGNLTLNGRITVNDGKGFFAAITSGNINIDPSVAHPNDPALEGIFMANGTISTGTKSPNADDRLYVRGALVGWGGIALQRDLDPNKTSGANNLTAAEYVEYAPDLILTFPRELLREGIVWKEVAP